MKKFKKILSVRILGRVIITMMAYTMAIAILLFVGQFVDDLIVWDINSLIYRFRLIIKEHFFFLLVFTFVAGNIIIPIYYWIKTLSYLEDVIRAAENIYDVKDELIELPPELKEVDNQMNQIKLNVQKSEHIAREAEQRKNDLIVYLAHDLKTPLTSVIGYLTLLRDEGQISEELRERYLSISLEKAERLEDLINEFFEITRFNLSNITLELSRVSLTRMLEQIIYEFKPMLSEKNLKCILNSSGDISIKCDVDKMQRVFDNLLNNAVSYSFTDSTIEITVIEHDDYLTLRFLNHGNTIPEEKLNRVFEQFYRLDAARATKSGRSGLGLAISKEIVELHHGDIKAFSENELIIFEVTIPVL